VSPRPDGQDTREVQNSMLCQLRCDGAIDLAFAFVIERESFFGKRNESRLLHFPEVSADLLTGGAVNPRVRNLTLPVSEELVMCGDISKQASLESVVFHILDAALDLPLVTRHVWSGRHEYKAVIPCKLDDLRIELRIEPVRILSRRFFRLSILCASLSYVSLGLNLQQAYGGLLILGHIIIREN